MDKLKLRIGSGLYFQIIYGYTKIIQLIIYTDNTDMKMGLLLKTCTGGKLLRATTHTLHTLYYLSENSRTEDLFHSKMAT